MYSHDGLPAGLLSSDHVGSHEMRPRSSIDGLCWQSVGGRKRAESGGPAGRRTGTEIKNPRRQYGAQRSSPPYCRRGFLIYVLARTLAGPPIFTISPPRGRPVGASLKAM